MHFALFKLSSTSALEQGRAASQWEPLPCVWGLGTAFCTAEEQQSLKRSKGMKWHGLVLFFCTTVFQKQANKKSCSLQQVDVENQTKRNSWNAVEKWVMQSNDLGLLVSLPTAVQIKWKIESIHQSDCFLFSLRAGEKWLFCFLCLSLLCVLHTEAAPWPHQRSPFPLVSSRSIHRCGSVGLWLSRVETQRLGKQPEPRAALSVL